MPVKIAFFYTDWQYLNTQNFIRRTISSVDAHFDFCAASF
jgi:hypothetical protein